MLRRFRDRHAFSGGTISIIVPPGMGGVYAVTQGGETRIVHLSAGDVIDPVTWIMQLDRDVS